MASREKPTTGGVREPYRLLDLFSGIGGFSLGLERTGGFKTVAFCEIEEFPRRVLAKHWPGVPIYEDVRTLTADCLAADGICVDVICGGFPCQDISLANQSAEGLAGARSGLWWEYARLIGELRPRVVVVENVAALVERGLGDVLGRLSLLGYDAWWRPIRAADVTAPHARERLWIVAYARGQGREGFEPIIRALERALAALSEHGHAFAGAWRALDGDLADIRACDGLSVAMERRRIRAAGNAVVPQIPELIGRAILAAELAGSRTPLNASLKSRETA
jgi:DNA (cytosine-5)-methyltransferase 1